MKAFKLSAGRETMRNVVDFEGTYQGFSPTDESDCGYGEMEVIVQNDVIKIRIATGLTIQKEEVKTAKLIPVPPERVREIWKGDTPSSLVERTFGFSVGEFDGRGFYFIADPEEDDLALILRGGMGDLLGPTFLFNPKQVEQGRFSQILETL